MSAVTLRIRPLALAFLLMAGKLFAFDQSFWVWQRHEPLSADEIAVVQQQGVSHLYWHVGELVNSGDVWNWKNRFPIPAQNPGIRLIPVVRIVSKQTSPFTERSFESLRNALMPIATAAGALQIDYDAPDRLLKDYAQSLRRLHEGIRELTITALPHWSERNEWDAFRGSVDALFPMFYDFDPEPQLANDSPKPLIDPDVMNRMLKEWSRSPLPWHAGLPAFARLTIYNANGKSRGQIRNWNWDEITFNSALLGKSSDGFGIFLFEAIEPARVSNVSLAKGDHLVVRRTEVGLLKWAIHQAREEGAIGCAIFRLPESSAASSGLSLLQVTHQDASPALEVTVDGNAFVLKNIGNGDLLPQLNTTAHSQPGYRLEVAADSPLFREAEPGEFVKVKGRLQKTGGKESVIPFARCISFEFSELRAGQSLRTGLIQLVPGTDFRQTQFKIDPLDPEWKPIAPKSLH